MNLQAVKKMLSYDPKTGLFTWLVNRGRMAKIGGNAGTTDSSGYVQIKISGRSTLAHRLAFFFMTEKWPTLDVDHINRSRTDNRWSNLRLATRSQNSAHRAVRRNAGTTRVGNRYQARIAVKEGNKRRWVHLGMFSTVEEAHAAYLKRAKQLYGKFV